MKPDINKLTQARNDSPSPPSSPTSSSSSSPSPSSDSSSSSSELNFSDALQSPLTGLLDFEGFEGFGMTQIRNLGITNIDMPNFPNLPSLPALPALPSFNIPRLPQRLPNLANNLTANLTNLHNLTTSIPNLSYLSQLTSVYTSAELQNLFNLSRITTNLPTLPQLPQLPQFPQFPQLPIFSTAHFQRPDLFKPWGHLRESVRNMHRRLNDIVECSATNFHFKEYRAVNNTRCIRFYFLLNNFIYYCDVPIVTPHKSISSSRSDTTSGASSSSLNSKLSKNDLIIEIQKNSLNGSSGRLFSPSTSSGESGSAHRRHKDFSSSYRGFASYELLNTQPTQPNMLIKDTCFVRRFEFDADRSRFLFSSGENLYYFDDHPDREVAPHSPIKIETDIHAQKLDFRLCPSNADLVAFHCAGELWCVSVKNNQEVRLTHVSDLPTNGSRNVQANGTVYFGEYSYRSSFSLCCPEEDFSYDAGPILAGRPSQVIREEFKREQGFWWRPRNEYQVVDEPIEYQLLYEETDQSNVGIVRINSWDGAIEEHRFPKAGTKNPISRLKIVKFTLTKSNQIVDTSTIDLPDLRSIYPDYEYLLRAGWLGQKAIWCQLLNRKQTHLVIVLISLVESFEPQIIFEDCNDMFWIGSHDTLYFLNQPRFDSLPLCPNREISFIWSSAESGHRHLYFVKTKIRTSQDDHPSFSKKQLTEGQWEISEKDLWVDEDDMLIYFCGLRDTPLENHLYVISYADIIGNDRHGLNQNSSRIRIHRLTEPNYSHSSVAFNPDCSMFINIQSNISTPPLGFVNLIVHNKPQKKDHRRLPDSKRLASLLINTYNYPIFDTCHLENLKSIGSKPSIMYDCQTDLLPGLAKPELFCCQLTSGELIYGSVFKPEFMESGATYPTVLEIYGGPETQLISNNFMNLRQPLRHLLSSEGYVVVIIDCRGSGKRGQSFEAHTYRRMGQVEIADQIEVLQWLAKSTGYIDMTRVAISGWSYGGYLSLMALAQYPKVFKVAIAGAPVTSWHMYDTAYTERFMGLPSENPEGYFKGGVLNYAHLFPDE